MYETGSMTNAPCRAEYTHRSTFSHLSYTLLIFQLVNPRQLSLLRDIYAAHNMPRGSGHRFCRSGRAAPAFRQAGSPGIQEERRA